MVELRSCGLWPWIINSFIVDKWDLLIAIRLAFSLPLSRLFRSYLVARAIRISQELPQEGKIEFLLTPLEDPTNVTPICVSRSRETTLAFRECTFPFSTTYSPFKNSIDLEVLSILNIQYPLFRSSQFYKDSIPLIFTKRSNRC